VVIKLTKNEGTNQTEGKNPCMDIPWKREEKVNEFSIFHYSENLSGERLIAVHRSF
jgi:hypothetical protein